MTMLEKIYAGIYHYDEEYPKYEWRNRKMTGADKYIRHDLYEALEAENKMLAEALGNISRMRVVLNNAENNTTLYAAKAIATEALAQRIGGKQ